MGSIELKTKGEKFTLALSGSFRIDSIERLARDLNSFDLSLVLEIDGARVEEIDTASIAVLLSAFERCNRAYQSLSFVGFSERHKRLIELVQSRRVLPGKKNVTTTNGLLYKMGEAAVDAKNKALDVLAFMGETIYALGKTIKHPKLLRKKELVVQLELGCVNAIPIVSLVTLLIGIVVAYLFAGQFEKYGANVFIVDAVSLAMCRELSPILVAIIVAGRSGSAFTAQIGTMKLNEEIDALTILGLSPMQVLVIPRLLALMVAMPLLVFVGDIMGIFGGLVIADSQLDVTGITFLQRLEAVLTVRHVCVGFVKAPVFAAFIAVIGCRMGLCVENNARSVGIHTTSTVVQSIVSVILLNAAFAVMLVKLHI